MEKNDKNKWVEDTLTSLNGIQKPTAPQHIFAGIQQRINGHKIVSLGQNNIIPYRNVSIAAAIIVLLVSINFYLLKRASKTLGNQDGMANVAAWYQLTDNNPIYSL